MEENLRLQDAVARTAGTDLKTTVRVLRALAIVTSVAGEKALSDAVERLLHDSVYNGGNPMPLTDKPTRAASDASERFNKQVLKAVGFNHLEKLRALDGCPYQASVLYNEAVKQSD